MLCYLLFSFIFPLSCHEDRIFAQLTDCNRLLSDKLYKRAKSKKVLGVALLYREKSFEGFSNLTCEVTCKSELCDCWLL